MLFDENVILENDVVLLRPLEIDDIKNLAHFVENEPEIWKYSLVSISTRSELEKYINQAVANRLSRLEYPFIVYDKKNNSYAGSTRFYDIQFSYQYLQLGYTWYGKSFQGTHVNKNCKMLLLEYAFEKLNMERVEFRADNRNECSKLAMEKIGCKVEGILRNHLPIGDGSRRDSIVLSILRSEWDNGVKKTLITKCVK